MEGFAMRRQALLFSIVTFFPAASAWPQERPGRDQNVPIYRVTVIERTVRAVNYQYRGGPTRIDFKGTVLMPHAKGEAVVESKAVRTEVDVKLEHLSPPGKFGTGYLA